MSTTDNKDKTGADIHYTNENLVILLEPLLLGKKKKKSTR